MAKNIIIPYFVSMQGCKNHCIYCNQFALKGHGEHKSIKELIEQYLKMAKFKDVNVELAFYGGTFLNLPKKKRDSLLKEAQECKNEGSVSKIRISTTPESVSREKCEEMKGIVDTIELGVQSLDDFILKILNRSDRAKTIKWASYLLKELGFEIGHQIMVGLPYETFQTFAKTVSAICEIKPDFVRIYPLMIFKNTPLAVYYGLKLFAMLEEEEVIKRIAYGLYFFERQGIKVIRVGLEAFTDSEYAILYNERDWRGKAYAFLYGELLKQNLDKNLPEELTIFCSQLNLSYIARFLKEYKSFLKERGCKRYSLKTLTENGNIASGAVFLKELDKWLYLSQLDWTKVRLKYN